MRVILNYKSLYEAMKVGVTNDGYYCTYDVTELKVGDENVNTENPPSDFNGQTSGFKVKWNQDAQTGLWTITNQEKPRTTATATKAWKNADRTTTAPAGATVVFELYSDAETAGTQKATGKTVTLNGKIDVATEEDVTGAETHEVNADAITAKAYESAAWTATWTDLVKYRDDGTTEIKYSVKEVTKYTGYEPDYESVDSGGTITNEQQSAVLNILKVDAKQTSKTLDGATFTIQKVNETISVNEPSNDDTWSYTESDKTKETTDGGRATFEGLVYGYYKITETSTPEGYVITGDSKFYIKIDQTGTKLVKPVKDTMYMAFQKGTQTAPHGGTVPPQAGIW